MLDFNVPMSFKILYRKGGFMSFVGYFKLKLKDYGFIIHISLRLLAVSNLGKNPVLVLEVETFILKILYSKQNVRKIMSR
jgi:hypothetical protein